MPTPAGPPYFSDTALLGEQDDFGAAIPVHGRGFVVGVGVEIGARLAQCSGAVVNDVLVKLVGVELQVPS